MKKKKILASPPISIDDRTAVAALGKYLTNSNDSISFAFILIPRTHPLKGYATWLTENRSQNVNSISYESVRKYVITVLYNGVKESTEFLAKGAQWKINPLLVDISAPPQI